MKNGNGYIGHVDATMGARSAFPRVSCTIAFASKPSQSSLCVDTAIGARPSLMDLPDMIVQVARASAAE